MSERNVDAEFDAIVARWDDPSNVFSGDRPEAVNEPIARLDPPVTSSWVTRVDDDPQDHPRPEAGDESARRAGGDHPLTPVRRLKPINPAFEPPPADPIEQSWRGYEPAEPDDTFVPPPPAPMPKAGADPTFWTITACLTLGPFLLMVLAVTGGLGRGWLVTIGGVLTAVGFILLVLRLPSGDTSDGDDGARV